LLFALISVKSGQNRLNIPIINSHIIDFTDSDKLTT